MLAASTVVNDKDVKIERKLKCVVLGDSQVGKTCLLLQLSYTSNTMSRANLESIATTYLANINVSGKVYQLELWDTDCQESSDSLRPAVYPETDVYCLCFSVADTDSFRHIKQKWYREVKEFSPRAPIILVGTKLDLRNDSASGKDDQFVSFKAGRKLAKAIGAIKYIECSALKQAGYAHVFSEAVRAATQRQVKRRGGRKCTIL